jgi:hypothetical protein
VVPASSLEAVAEQLVVLVRVAIDATALDSRRFGKVEWKGSTVGGTAAAAGRRVGPQAQVDDDDEARIRIQVREVANASRQQMTGVLMPWKLGTSMRISLPLPPALSRVCSGFSVLQVSQWVPDQPLVIHSSLVPLMCSA